MSKFSHIADTVKRTATALVAIEGLDNMRPVLTVKPATEANPAYMNALLKRQRRGRARRLSQINAKVLAQFRNDDRELIAEHCVTGWDSNTVPDAEDNPVSFTKEDCLDLFKALPDDIFDDFRNEVADPGTFTELNDPEDVAAQAGN